MSNVDKNFPVNLGQWTGLKLNQRTIFLITKIFECVMSPNHKTDKVKIKYKSSYHLVSFAEKSEV